MTLTLARRAAPRLFSSLSFPPSRAACGGAAEGARGFDTRERAR